MVRGIERQRIFRRDTDLADWIGRMNRLAPVHQMRCYAWVLMPNHVHLVVQSGRGELSRFMARVNTGYAKAFNLRYERTGYLFENRFRSRLVRDDADLLNLIRYVHMNPVKAHLVDSLAGLARFVWCGHAALIGARPPHPFQDVDFVLRQFGEDRPGARRRLSEWMGEEFDDVRAPEKTAEDPFPDIESPSGGSEQTLAELTECVCSHFEVDPRHVASSRRGKSISLARAAIAFLAVDQLGMSGSQLIEKLCLSRSGVSRAIARGDEICSTEHLGQQPKTPRNGDAD